MHILFSFLRKASSHWWFCEESKRFLRRFGFGTLWKSSHHHFAMIRCGSVWAPGWHFCKEGSPKQCQVTTRTKSYCSLFLGLQERSECFFSLPMEENLQHDSLEIVLAICYSQVLLLLLRAWGKCCEPQWINACSWWAQLDLTLLQDQGSKWMCYELGTTSRERIWHPVVTVSWGYRWCNEVF